MAARLCVAGTSRGHGRPDQRQRADSIVGSALPMTAEYRLSPATTKHIDSFRVSRGGSGRGPNSPITCGPESCGRSNRRRNRMRSRSAFGHTGCRVGRPVDCRSRGCQDQHSDLSQRSAGSSCRGCDCDGSRKEPRRLRRTRLQGGAVTWITSRGILVACADLVCSSRSLP